MAITEQQRFEMHLGLRKHLGEDVANSLMEHLPPSGWSDVVRLKDFEALERRLELRIDAVENRLIAFENRINGNFKVLIGVLIPVSLGIIGALIQISLMIAGLK